MTPTPFSTEQRRARLWARHHLDRTANDVTAAITHLVAMHSSDPLTPHLGLLARLPDYRPEALHDALETRSLWRMHAMRRTLWVVNTDEAPVFDGAASRTIAAAERRRLLGWVAATRPDAEPWLATLERDTLAAIAASPGVLTRKLSDDVPELATEITLGSGKWTTRSSIASRLLMVLAMEGKLHRTAPAGSWRSSQYGWVVAPNGFGDPLDDGVARAALLRRYLARFGPATLTDLRWWTGWTAAQTRKALAATQALEVPLDDGTGWLLPEDLDHSAPEPRGVALLPGLDPTPMGYKERDWFLGDLAPHLFDTNGNIGPTVWLDGRIVGGWAIRPDGTVATRLLVGADEEAVVAAADALTAWLGGTSATPRFRTPLEKELAG